jgi:hypothetical protein
MQCNVAQLIYMAGLHPRRGVSGGVLCWGSNSLRFDVFVVVTVLQLCKPQVSSSEHNATCASQLLPPSHVGHVNCRSGDPG